MNKLRGLSRNMAQTINTLRDIMVKRAVEAGHTIIVDDAKFDPEDAERLKKLAEEHNAAFELKDFDPA